MCGRDIQGRDWCWALHNVHDYMQCWKLPEWIVHINHHSIVCRMCFRVLCAIIWFSDQLQCLHINMQHWLLSEWIVHYNHHSLLLRMHQQLQRWVLFEWQLQWVIKPVMRWMS